MAGEDLTQMNTKTIHIQWPQTSSTTKQLSKNTTVTMYVSHVKGLEFF